ncbi:dTDP-4-dehydrorhamnose reductase [Imtechella halotolerans]|uniref:dTDP-4-dehydrorhamnose reductase n=1 Tax=Imtechella halotolerans K1 TaxID=946077 RepID=I0W6K8_9FLAO|nr:dTDP-4-dehydrorhamnose reductase [Imtechella halotolerans]EID72024.1 dTDP-4-dehydrorhamnose reductase [Imtechella halotolerans K1]WMQ63984.1 dTDP-4-dehydrorhamnose reductase [Imtechella halotolerans]
MEKVLVFGAKGQLGSCLQDAIQGSPWQSQTVFYDSSACDVTKEEDLTKAFKEVAPTYVINCAAYTAVDKAEEETLKAFEVNAKAPECMARLCREYNTVLIHISTDFVFDGHQDMPYKEEVIPNPLNVYGTSKWEGEQRISSTWHKHYIIRTSWLYSIYPPNFVHSVLRLAKERNKLTVVADQQGIPTYAPDLAAMLLLVLESKHLPFGIYHYANKGIASWYTFATAILKMAGSNIPVTPITSEQFPAKAIRPKYSVLDTSKIESELALTIPNWEVSLKRCMDRLKESLN